MVKGNPSADSSKSADASAASDRLENTTACLPIVSGSVAFFLGKKADDYQTHQWTLYLRGPRNEDLSFAISKVVFQLHPSFAEPTRELTEPPYEVTERGWGEFEAQIRIFWKDANEQTTLLLQPIKLYPPGTPANTTQTDTENPVVAENYDEVVFTNPTETFYQQLQSVGRVPPVSYTQEDHFPEYSDSKEVKLLLEAHRVLQDELALAKERLLQVDGDLAQVDEALRQQQDKRKKAAAAAAKNGSAKPAARSKSSAPRPASAVPASKKAKTST